MAYKLETNITQGNDIAHFVLTGFDMFPQGMCLFSKPIQCFFNG